MSSRPQPPHLEAFAVARSLLDNAAVSRTAVIATWNNLEQDDVFEAWLDTTNDVYGELQAGSFLPEQASATLSEHAAAFLTTVKGAMDAAVLATTAQTVCAPLWPIDPEAHRMPLASTPAEFDALVPRGHLLGLRPDEVRTLRELQPFTDGSPAAEFISLQMSHLLAALAALGDCPPEPSSNSSKSRSSENVEHDTATYQAKRLVARSRRVSMTPWPTPFNRWLCRWPRAAPASGP